MSDRDLRLRLDTVKRIESPSSPGPNIDTPSSELAHLRQANHLYKRSLYVAIGLILIVGGSFIATRILRAGSKAPDPVPLSIRRQAKFNIYFPEQAKLPSGYTLETNSFSITEHVVLYKLSCDDNQQLFFSVQAKPSASAIQNFYKTRMPLTTSVATSVGTAAIGVLNNETVGSLLTNTDAWILVTAPPQVSQGQFKQILQSMTLAQ